MKNVNWTQIIFSIIIVLGAWLFVPSPFHKCPEPLPPLPGVPYAVPGDTIESFIPVPVFVGSDSGTALIKEEYYEYAVEDTGAFGKLNITARAYPYTENDSLKVDMYIIYGVEPRPMKTTVTKDTIFVPQPVPVPQPVQLAFYEEPVFVAPVSAIAGIITTLLIVNATK